MRSLKARTSRRNGDGGSMPPPALTEAGVREWAAQTWRAYVGGQTDPAGWAALEAIVRRALEPANLRALRERRDLGEALLDLATAQAVDAYLDDDWGQRGRPDRLSERLLGRAFNLVTARNAWWLEHYGVDPLAEDPGRWGVVRRALASYRPLRPLGVLIQKSLSCWTSPLHRFVLQLRSLLRHPQVHDAFATFLAQQRLGECEVDEEERERNQRLADGLRELAADRWPERLDQARAVAWFARPEVVAFVKRYAATVEPARTLYAEEEYADVPWQGKRALRRERRQGYLEAAMEQVDRQARSGQTAADAERRAEMLDALPDPQAELAFVRVENAGWLHRQTFEQWVVATALEAAPDDPLWQLGGLLYLQGLPAATSPSGAPMLAELEARIEALRANTEVWQAWLEATLA